MALETRFARGPSGPIPYRVDGSGDAQLMIISDWHAPYGAPGRGAFEAFVAELARRNVRTVTMLDGITGGGAAPSADQRARSAQSVARTAGLQEATLLGTAAGGPTALALARIDPDRFGRLVLYDTFPPDSSAAWKPPATSSAPPEGAESDAPQAAMPELAELGELGELANHIQTATAAAALARQFWERLPRSDRKSPKPDKPPKADKGPPPVPVPPGLQWVGERIRGELPSGGGLAELLRNIASLESATQEPHGLPPPAIRIPTLVLDAGIGQEGETGSDANLPGSALGLEVASRIDGARHRAIRGISRWPWGEAQVASQLLEPAITASLPLLEAPDSAPTQTDARARERVLATVLFTDIVGSTERLTQVGDAEWRKLLERHHRIVRREIGRFEGREVDNAGDGFLAAFGMPALAVRCAAAVRDQVHEVGLQIRGGLHTGECERVGDKLVGIAVHIGARIAGHAGADEILVSSTVRDLVAGSGIRFDARETVTLKGIPGDWPLYAVIEVD